MTDDDPQQDLVDSAGMALGLNIAEAVRATRNGSIAAFISAGMTLLVVVIAISTSAFGNLQVFNDPWNLFGALLIVALGLVNYPIKIRPRWWKWVSSVRASPCECFIQQD